MASIFTSNEFIIKFHSLTGTTIGERRKNLFLLLHEASRNQLIIDFPLLKPKTPLEEDFKLETLIHFKKIEELFTLVISENPILVHKIIKKASPLLLQSLSDFSDLQLLNFLSRISLNAKLKLLNKFGDYLNNKTQKAEEFFKAIKDKYGVYLATKLLVACSPEFILDFLETTRFKFTSHQLLILTKRHPSLICRLLEILHKYVDVVQEYRNVFKYLSQNNVPLFISLHKTYKLHMLHLGWRTTNNLIQHNKSNIINDAKLYLEILQDKYIKKCLRGDDFNLFYYRLFPVLISQFDKSYEQLLTLAPSLEVLLLGFHRTYDCELYSEPKFITPKLLEMMPNEERLKMLKEEYKPSEFTDDDWICYLSTSDAITLLKKRILLTSDIKSRAKLITLLVETCRINKDKAALADLCSYMVKQHRNDHISVRLSFLKAVRKGFKLENLVMAHWSIINELMQIFQLNGEEFYYIDEYLMGYMECRLKNKQPIKEQLVVWLERRSFWGSWNLFKEKPSFEKVCLQTIPMILPELTRDSICNAFAYFNAVVNWNKRHPKDILTFDMLNLIESLKEASKQENFPNYANRDTVMTYVLHTKTIPDRQTLIELYIPYMDINKIFWLTHSDLDFFIKNLDACINVSLKSTVCTKSLWLYCKSYSHLDIPQRIINICLYMLSQELQDDQKVIKKNALTALSYLMPTPDLLTLKYNVRPYMKHCTPDTFLVETVLKHCTANHLPSVRRAIFSLMNNLNENNLLHFITQLMQVKKVNVRKVALYILFRTMDKQTIMNTLKSFIKNDENAVLNKFVLSTVFKFFIKNPNEYIWNIIQLCIGALDPDDQEAYDLLLQTDKIPSEYLTRYILFMWSTVEKLHAFYKEYGIKILRVAQINLLPQEFCENLIDTYFFRNYKNYSSFYSELHAFVCKYLCYNPGKLEEYVIRVLQSSNTTNLKLRGYINQFVKQLCYECIRQNRKDVLTKFATIWNASLKPYEMFHEYLYIQLSLIKLENLSSAEIANRLVPLCIFLTDNYGVDFLYPFSCEVKSFSEAHFIKGNNDEETEINRFTLVEKIVHSGDSLVLILLGILLLADHQPNLIETKSKYDALTTIFQKRSEPEVLVYLN